ncbi:MAG: DUF2853 family protein [Pseudomonadota bacterium]
MNKRDALIEKYAEDIKTKCKQKPDMDLLRKVTIGCGPVIYNKDSSTVSSTDQSELDTVRNNFLIKKLGLTAGDKLEKGLQSAIETYGKSNKTKYRAVLYYLLVKEFGKEKVYDK